MFFLCLMFSAIAPYPMDAHRMNTCIDVAYEADAQGVPETLAISLAYVESRFNKHAVSRAGAIGPMQILPQYTCAKISKNEACDLILEGVFLLRVWARRAWKRHGRRHVTDRHALAMYHGGNNPRERSYRYADKILGLQSKIKKEIKRWRLE